MHLKKPGLHWFECHFTFVLILVASTFTLNGLTLPFPLVKWILQVDEP